MAPITGRLILANKKFTENLAEGEEYFGVPQGEICHFGVYSEENARPGKTDLLHFLASRAEGNIVI